MNSLRHLRTFGLLLLFFFATSTHADGLRVNPEALFQIEARVSQPDAVILDSDLIPPKDEFKVATSFVATSSSTSSTLAQAPAELAQWKLSNYVRSVGFDIYDGSTHLGSKDRGKPVEQGGVNENNNGWAFVVTLNLMHLCVWKDTCMKIVHDSYRTEFFIKTIGRIRNSQNGDTDHYGVGFITLYTPQVSQRYRLLLGGGAERLRLKYCVPKYNGCLEGLATIPFATAGLEYSSKGLRLLFAPKQYLIPTGKAGKTRVKLRAHWISGEIEFWGL